jgi:hypothetical protein
MAEESRYELLAELWDCTVEEAQKRDEAHQAAVAEEQARAQAVASGEEPPPLVVKKNDAAVDDLPASDIALELKTERARRERNEASKQS